MKLDLTDDQKLLQDTFAKVFREESTPTRVRAAEQTSGHDAVLWRQLVALGLPLMRVPEDRGGSGLSLLDAAVAVEEAGRRLACAPVVESIVASALVMELNPPDSLRRRIVEGTIVTLALSPITEGEPQVVPAGAIADVIVARQGDRLIALTDLAPREMARNVADSPVALLDLVELSASRVEIGSGPDACAAYDAALEAWKLLVAANLVGACRQALEMAAAYSNERIQFGKPIGSFQGLAHPLANAATDVDGARLMIWRAIWAIANGHADAAAAVSMSYWWAADTIERATKQALRTFGGYGLSLEYDIQLYYRRTKLVSLLAGPPVLELDRVAARLWQGETVALPSPGEIGVDFGFGAKAEAFKAELRSFIEANMTPEVEAKKHHSTSGHHAGFFKKLAAAGMLLPDLPLDAAPARDRYEVAAALPLWEDFHWTHTIIGMSDFIAKMSLRWSTEAAKAEILPRVFAGEALACLGFSEPGSGSDVFAAKLSAVRDGDEWVINGQKMFTTNAHNADYILLLARNDPTLKKHQGLTMFIAPLRLPGVDIQPVQTLQDERTNIVYFGDVRIHDRYRLGEVGDGARVMASALGIEHGGWEYHTAQMMMLKHALAWARTPGASGERPIDTPDVRRALARAWTQGEVADVLCRRQIWGEAEGLHDPTWGPMAKLFTTETMSADTAAIVALAAPQSLLRGRNADLDMVELTMRRSLAMTVYGGASEVHRSIIAEKSLGMPNSRS
jgi:alkylation response protein AidB-like acyl-CoA dehydrogenase